MMTKKIDPFDLSAGTPGVEGNLRPPPKFAERISKRVLFVVFGALAVVMALFILALEAMDKEKVEQPSESPTGVGGTGVPVDLLNRGRSGLTDLITPDKKVDPVVPASVPAPVVPAVDEYQRPPPLTPEQQRALTEQQARYQRDLQARTQGMAGKSFSVAGGAGGSAGSRIDEVLQQAKGLMAAGGAGGAQAGSGGGGAPGAQGESDQGRKLDFLSKVGKETQGYHPHMSMPALSKNEIKTGAFIPMVLEQSINSDLPGQITARVTEDVYDTISGCRMLIPAMSKVVGRYDSQVAIGQNRMLIAWNTMIFRDGAELNLAGLQGYDTSGAAGLESDVDNHYWRLFGLTFGLSMITAGVQLSVPQPNPTLEGGSAPQTPSQIIAASLSQQYGNLGSQIIGRYMAVQPTLRNFTGERFMIMVPRTIVFNKVWRNRCGG